MPSLHNFAHVCSHLQNVSKARLSMTSIPMTKLHLSTCLALQRQGFISSVDIGGLSPPVPETVNARSYEHFTHHLAVSPWDAYPDPKARNLPDRREPNTPENPAQRRIWVGMKYWNGEPVLSKMDLISKPTRRILLSLHDLRKIVVGFRAGYVKGLTRPGECLLVKTGIGIIEARECVERQVGGMALARVL
jgi:ribosomal protein S8